MKILLDECVPKDVKKYLQEHEVMTVAQCGWSGIKNGELLKLADSQFAAFITVDKNLSFQQNLTMLQVTVIVIHSKSNKLKHIEPILPDLIEVLKTPLEQKIIHLGI